MADLCGSDRLPSGYKILWENVAHSRTFSLGFFFPFGSRLDPPELAGLAHLVEHLVFKGTKLYSASELARRVDRVGGDLNAWTDREEMAFTCTVPAEHWQTAVESLVQLCAYPTFPDDEFEREKEVIRNEILASMEDPEELAYEVFLGSLDSGPWSLPVAGTLDSLKRLSRADAVSWHQNHLATGKHLCVVACGLVDVDELTRVLAATLPSAPQGSSLPVLMRRFSPGQLCALKSADFQMVQILGGWHFPAPQSLREATVWQVFSMLWGETMSSRLFQSLRERRGLCYSVTSQLFESEDSWGLHFFATGAPENARPLVQALHDEILRLTTDPPHLAEWDDARLALRGAMILGSERMENRVGRLWRFSELFDRVESHDSALAELEVPVSPDERAQIHSRLTGEQPSLLVWGRSRLRSTVSLKAIWHA